MKGFFLCRCKPIFFYTHLAPFEACLGSICLSRLMSKDTESKGGSRGLQSMKLLPSLMPVSLTCNMPNEGWEISSESILTSQNTRQCLSRSLRLTLTQNFLPISFPILPARNPVLFLESPPRPPLWKTWAHCSLLMWVIKYSFRCSYTRVIQLCWKLNNWISWASTVFLLWAQHCAKGKTQFLEHGHPRLRAKDYRGEL